MRRLSSIAAVAVALLCSTPLAAQTKGVTSGQKVPRLIIRNATMVDGNGTPARGPVDIVIENGKIADVVTLEGEMSRREADLESLEAQQRLLVDQTSLATLSVDLTAATAAPEPAAGTDGGFVVTPSSTIRFSRL